MKSIRETTIQHPVTFQNKTVRVDTRIQISKKRQTQALLLTLRPGTLPVVVFMTNTYNCGHEWSCDYRGNSSALRCQLSTVMTQNATGGDCQTAEQNWIGAVTQRTLIQWKLGVTVGWNQLSTVLKKNTYWIITILQPDSIMFIHHQDQPLRKQLIDFGEAVPAAKTQSWMDLQPSGYKYLYVPQLIWSSALVSFF